jgi:uncharacterized phage protein (TIGR01671 family)
MRINVKFKFYDKKRKWLMDVTAIDWEKGIIVGLYHRQIFISLIEHGNLLQYTGVKDKNGKEIYEGYIVNWFDELGKNDQPFVVEYKPAHFVLTHPNEKLASWDLEKQKLEVIGDIYQNPDWSVR